jgi:hypothetical protein
VIVVFAFTIVGVTGYLARNELVESWQLSQLAGSSPAAIRDRIDWLRKHGGPWTANKLCDLTADPAIREAALEAIPHVFERLSTRARVDSLRILERMLDSTGSASGSAEAFVTESFWFEIVRVADQDLEVLRELARMLRWETWPTARIRLTLAVLHSAARNPWPVNEMLSSLSRADLARFLEGVVRLSRVPWRPDVESGSPQVETWKAVISRISTMHADPATRAVAIVFLARIIDEKNHGSDDFQYLSHAFEHDSSPLVKIAAIQVAGLLGPRPGSLDLSSLLFDVNDPDLLTKIVEARTLWFDGSLEVVDALEVFDGFVCPWIPWDLGPESEEVCRWKTAELERLESIVATSQHGRLRAAASRALASRFRTDGQPTRAEPIDGFSAHEWTLFRERDDSPALEGSGLEDLPDFVHRIPPVADSSAQFGSARNLRMEIVESFVRFQSPRRIPVLARVKYSQGRPRAYFPNASESTLEPNGPVALADIVAPRRAELTASHGRGVDSFASLAPERSGSSTNSADARTTERGFGFTGRAIGSTDQFSRSWIYTVDDARVLDFRTFQGYFGAIARVPRHELDRIGATTNSSERHSRGASWVRRRSPATDAAGGSLQATAGLEWCGLLIGCPDRLDAASPTLTPEHRWQLQREIPGARLSAQDENEHFLFHSGAVRFPGPISVTWSDPSRSTLLLAARPFHEYPDSHRFRSEPGPTSGVRIESPGKASSSGIRAVFVLSRERDGDLRGRAIEMLLPAEQIEDAVRIPIDELPLSLPELEARLVSVLDDQGLTRAESETAVKSWKSEIFDRPGLRVISVVPRWLHDELVPLDIFPIP